MSQSTGNTRELFQSFVKGWCDGAAMRVMRKVFTEHPTRPDLKESYSDGYAQGCIARRAACKAEADRIGHVPTILRTAKVSP